MKSKYISENTLDLVSLHDCVIESISIEEQNLQVFFEHIDVVSEHPLNDTGKSMCTGKANIKFVDYVVEECILYDTSNIQGNRKIIVEEDAEKKVLPISELLIDFEVLSTDLRECDSHYICRLDGTSSLRYRADFGFVIIRFKKLYIEWNEFIGKAWFEDFNEK